MTRKTRKSCSYCSPLYPGKSVLKSKGGSIWISNIWKYLTWLKLQECKQFSWGLESMAKIIDPSPLPIPDRQSKMLPGWVWGFKNYLKCWGHERVPLPWAEAICECFSHLTVARVRGPVTRFCKWVRPFKIPRKPRISSRVHYFFGWVQPFKIPRKLRGSLSSRKFWTSPSFKISRNCRENRILRIFWVP